jgi:hypothetical protein
MKLNIRKKLVSVAVASAVTGAALMASPAQALNVSQDNVGQVLLFPYYTVKKGFDTLFYVDNTSSYTAVFKIRWREALNSREVRDFNVVLSPNDVWTGAVTMSEDGTGAVVRTFDKSCTSPQLPAGPNGSTEIPFTNALFSGKYADGASDSNERVQEGYFEVILMGVSGDPTSDSNNVLEYNAKHVNGVPRDCAMVDSLFTDTSGNLGYMSGPQNILKGHTTFINVGTGKAIDVEPTAIEDFAFSNIVYPPSNDLPNLANGTSFDYAYRITNGTPQEKFFDNSANGVSDALRASSVINDYATGANVASSWVMTFPTKHHYTDLIVGSGSVPSTDPLAVVGDGFSDWFFTKNSSGTTIDGKSCDDIDITTWNREEGGKSSGTDFSPKVGESASLCYEVNVIDFNGTNVFGTGTNHNSLQAVGAAGWAEISFSESSQTSIGGLPVIGFQATVRDSGDATVNFGSATEHTYRRSNNGWSSID